MSKVCVFLADGFEECEGLLVVDLLRRAGVEVTTASIHGGRAVTGSHGIRLEADAVAGELEPAGFDLLVLPGGGEGTQNLAASPLVARAIQSALDARRKVGAICAAPSVLGRMGLLQGRRATCYPGFEPYLEGAQLTHTDVAVDGGVITGRALGAAIPFALELIAQLEGRAKADEVREAIVYGG